MMALPALWVGLLYDKGARQAAWELTKGWSFDELLDFQGEVARQALRAKGPGGVTALELAREVARIARTGLQGWEKLSGFDERGYLDPLNDILDTGHTLAERVLRAYKDSGGDPASVVPLWQIA
jgi:glutamate--cysteine ligase